MVNDQWERKKAAGTGILSCAGSSQIIVKEAPGREQQTPKNPNLLAQKLAVFSFRGILTSKFWELPFRFTVI